MKLSSTRYGKLMLTNRLGTEENTDKTFYRKSSQLGEQFHTISNPEIHYDQPKKHKSTLKTRV